MSYQTDIEVTVRGGRLMNEIEERVLQAIDVDGMLKYLCDLIAVRSLVGDETAVSYTHLTLPTILLV